MKVKYYSVPFSEIKNGEVFLCKKDGECPFMKIETCQENGANRNVVRLEDGRLFIKYDSDIVYPIKCSVMREL